MKQMTKLGILSLIGIVYVGFHFYAMGYNADSINLHGHVRYLDKMEHFVSGVIISCLAIALMEKQERHISSCITFSTVLFLAVLFEFLESYTRFLGGMTDTILDIIVALIGAGMVIVTSNARDIFFQK